jgi:hypothetical protein
MRTGRLVTHVGEREHLCDVAPPEIDRRVETIRLACEERRAAVASPDMLIRFQLFPPPSCKINKYIQNEVLLAFPVRGGPIS